MGFGGAGKAISAFLLKDFKKKHRIQIFNRSNRNTGDTKNIGINLIPLNELDTYLPHFDLLINATSVGHTDNKSVSPVPTKSLQKAKKNMIVYDIIYDPIETELLKKSAAIGLRTINGLRMNLVQAVFAYAYTNPTDLSMAEIYEVMN